MKSLRERIANRPKKQRKPNFPKDPSLDYLAVMAKFLRSTPIPISVDTIMEDYISFPGLNSLVRAMEQQGVIEEHPVDSNKFRLTQEGGRYAMDCLIALQTSDHPVIKRFQEQRLGRGTSSTSPTTSSSELPSNVLKFPGR